MYIAQYQGNDIPSLINATVRHPRASLEGQLCGTGSASIQHMSYHETVLHWQWKFLCWWEVIYMDTDRLNLAVTQIITAVVLRTPHPEVIMVILLDYTTSYHPPHYIRIVCMPHRFGSGYRSALWSKLRQMTQMPPLSSSNPSLDQDDCCTIASKVKSIYIMKSFEIRYVVLRLI